MLKRAAAIFPVGRAAAGVRRGASWQIEGGAQHAGGEALWPLGVASGQMSPEEAIYRAVEEAEGILAE